MPLWRMLFKSKAPTPRESAIAPPVYESIVEPAQVVSDDSGAAVDDTERLEIMKMYKDGLITAKELKDMLSSTGRTKNPNANSEMPKDLKDKDVEDSKHKGVGANDVPSNDRLPEPKPASNESEQPRDLRPAYKAHQIHRGEGDASGKNVNIAGTDLAAFIMSGGDVDKFITLQREAMKAQMDYGRGYDATQEIDKTGNGYNVAGLGFNPDAFDKAMELNRRKG